MKCKLAIAFVTALMITSAPAQSAGDAPAKADAPPPKPALDAKSKVVVDRLTRTLSLTAQQQAKLTDMAQAHRVKTAEHRQLIQELFKAAGAKQSERVKELQKKVTQAAGSMKSLQDAMYEQLAPILTPEQAERLKQLRNPPSSTTRTNSRRERIDATTLKQIRIDLELNTKQKQQFDVIAGSQSTGNTFTRLDAILNDQQKKILSAYHERYASVQIRSAEIRNIWRVAERLDLDTKQQREVKGIRKSARKQLILLRSGSDKVSADFAETLKNEIIAILKPAQVELFKKGLSRGRPAEKQTRGVGKTPAKKP